MSKQAMRLVIVLGLILAMIISIIPVSAVESSGADNEIVDPLDIHVSSIDNPHQNNFSLINSAATNVEGRHFIGSSVVDDAAAKQQAISYMSTAYVQPERRTIRLRLPRMTGFSSSMVTENLGAFKRAKITMNGTWQGVILLGLILVA